MTLKKLKKLIKMMNQLGVLDNNPNRGDWPYESKEECGWVRGWR